MKAMIFDVDGTLADTERDGHRVAFNLAFEEAGLDWGWDEALYGELLAVTGGKERIRQFIETKNPRVPEVEDLTVWIAGLHASKTKHFVALMEQGKIPLRSGVKRLLTEAHDAGVPLAIATTTTPENVSALLNNALFEGAESWFEVIGAGDIVPAKKPAPDIYTYVMEQMGLQPEQCIAFEDSSNGIRSSRAADLKTIVTVNGYTAEEDFSEAVLVLDQMGEADDPCTVLQGDDPGKRCLDLEWVRSLWES